MSRGVKGSNTTDYVDDSETRCIACSKRAEYEIENQPTCNRSECQSIISQAVGNDNSLARFSPYVQLKVRLYQAHASQLSDPQPINRLDLRWSNRLAVQRVDELYDRGIMPRSINEDPNGTAIYDNVPGKLGGFWEMLRIEDQARYHDKPKPHFDFLYATVRLRIPVDKRSLPIHDISTSITVDVTQSQVTAGCHFIGASVATLSIVKELYQGYITFEEAKDAYDRRIMQLAEEVGKEDTPLTDAYEAYLLA